MHNFSHLMKTLYSSELSYFCLSQITAAFPYKYLLYPSHKFDNPSGTHNHKALARDSC